MRSDEIQVITARWVLPVTSPAMEWGQVVVKGDRILDVRKGDPSQAGKNFGEMILIPALVNAHTHLDLSGFSKQWEKGVDFFEWLEGVIAFRNGLSPEQVQSDIRRGIKMSLKSGVGLVGDISSGGNSWDALHSSPLAAVVYYELLGLRESRAMEFWTAFDEWKRSRGNQPRLKVGISPHAPYSVRWKTICKAVQSGLPLQMHIAETKLELDLFRKQDGRFKDWLVEKQVYDQEGLASSLQIILDELQLSRKAALVHGTCLQPSGMAKSSLVYCPRTTDLFSQDEHPFEEMRKKGWRLALGTDGLTSSPDLNVLAEAQFLKKKHPSIPSHELLEMITIRGAEILGMEDCFGSLEPGKFADVAVFPLTQQSTLSPEDFLLTQKPDCQGLMLGGEWIFKV